MPPRPQTDLKEGLTDVLSKQFALPETWIIIDKLPGVIFKFFYFFLFFFFLHFITSSYQLQLFRRMLQRCILLNNAVNLFLRTVKLHMTFHQLLGEKIMTRLSFFNKHVWAPFLKGLRNLVLIESKSSQHLLFLHSFIKNLAVAV